MLLEALQTRLEVLEEEILRLTKLASLASDNNQQDNYYRLAQDVQREARELRLEIARATGSSSTGLDSSQGQTDAPPASEPDTSRSFQCFDLRLIVSAGAP